MNRIPSLLFVSILIFSCQPGGKLYEGAICIENITIIDPVDGVSESQTVIIKDDRIHLVAPSSGLKLSPENEIIDGSGKYLIPGLWDTHIHFAFREELAPRMFNLFLGFGITSVRDTGGEIEFVNSWKKKASDDPENAPRVMVAGPLLDGLPNVYDGSDAGHPPLSTGLGTLEDVESKIEELDGKGVDLLKAYEMLTPDQFKLITKLAREKGLKVTGHVPLSMNVIDASNAGMNSMEHMRNLELSCASNWEELWKRRQMTLEEGKNLAGGVLRSSIHSAQRQIAVANFDEDRANEVLDVLFKNDTWQIPTLTLNTNLARRPFLRDEFQESFAYLPQSIRDNWLESTTRINEMEISDYTKTYADWMFSMVERVHKRGIPIMAGTDTPIFFLTPGRSLHEELSVLVDAGLTPLEALKTATYNPAKYFNIESELGQVKTGMYADLIILDADPLSDINNTLLINTVIRNGKPHDREALDTMLDQ